MNKNKNFLSILGFNIRIERHRKGYSQEDLADLSGLHRTFIGLVERGEKNISIFNCLKITNALNITLYDLICCSEEHYFQNHEGLEQLKNARSNSQLNCVTELFFQLFCFFMDGTSRHITWFDHLKTDESCF